VQLYLGIDVVFNGSIEEASLTDHEGSVTSFLEVDVSGAQLSLPPTSLPTALPSTSPTPFEYMLNIGNDGFDFFGIKNARVTYGLTGGFLNPGEPEIGYSRFDVYLPATMISEIF
jgi:hypothetical protein